MQDILQSKCEIESATADYLLRTLTSKKYINNLIEWEQPAGSTA